VAHDRESVRTGEVEVRHQQVPALGVDQLDRGVPVLACVTEKPGSVLKKAFTNSAWSKASST
jgi:hypothetical protein